MLVVLIVVLILLSLGGLPSWGFHPYGYGPSGVLGILLIVVLVLLLLGHL